MIAAAGRLLDGFAGFGSDFRFEIELLDGFSRNFSRSPNRPQESPWSGKSHDCAYAFAACKTAQK